MNDFYVKKFIYIPILTELHQKLKGKVFLNMTRNIRAFSFRKLNWKCEFSILLICIFRYLLNSRVDNKQNKKEMFLLNKKMQGKAEKKL